MQKHKNQFAGLSPCLLTTIDPYMPAAFLASGNLLASTSIRRHLAPAPSALAALAAAPRCTPDVLPLRHAQSYLLPLLAGALQQQLDSNQMERKPVQTSPPADLPLQACNAGKQQQHWVQHWLRRQQACHALQQQPYPPQQQLQHLRSLATRSIPYVDRVRMEVQGGAGGNGCVSYTQVARGGGGDGVPVIAHGCNMSERLWAAVKALPVRVHHWVSFRRLCHISFI